MKNKFAALHYKKTDTLDVTSSSDTQSIVVSVMMNYLNQSSLFRIISYQIQLTSEKNQIVFQKLLL